MFKRYGVRGREHKTCVDFVRAVNGVAIVGFDCSKDMEYVEACDKMCTCLRKSSTIG